MKTLELLYGFLVFAMPILVAVTWLYLAYLRLRVRGIWNEVNDQMYAREKFKETLAALEGIEKRIADLERGKSA